jgi:hypothetical protein
LCSSDVQWYRMIKWVKRCFFRVKYCLGSAMIVAEKPPCLIMFVDIFPPPSLFKTWKNIDWWFQSLWKNISQLGLIFPTYSKICSKPPTRYQYPLSFGICGVLSNYVVCWNLCWNILEHCIM